MDLTVEATPVVRLTRGRWSALCLTPSTVLLSRVVDARELERNTELVPALGWCGYLALEWASRLAAGEVGRVLDLRLPRARRLMGRFLEGRLAACADLAVKAKLTKLCWHLVRAVQPWSLNMGTGLWLNVADIAHLMITFPLVIWGPDVGQGQRRVMYPRHGGNPMSLHEAGELSRSRNQFILDSAHFFPLDTMVEDAVVLLREVERSGGANVAGLDRGANLLLTPTIDVRANPVDGLVVVAPSQGLALMETPTVAVTVSTPPEGSWANAGGVAADQTEGLMDAKRECPGEAIP